MKVSIAFVRGRSFENHLYANLFRFSNFVTRASVFRYSCCYSFKPPHGISWRKREFFFFFF